MSTRSSWTAAVCEYLGTTGRRPLRNPSTPPQTEKARYSGRTSNGLHRPSNDLHGPSSDLHGPSSSISNPLTTNIGETSAGGPSNVLARSSRSRTSARTFAARTFEETLHSPDSSPGSSSSSFSSTWPASSSPLADRRPQWLTAEPTETDPPSSTSEPTQPAEPSEQTQPAEQAELAEPAERDEQTEQAEHDPPPSYLETILESTLSALASAPTATARARALQELRDQETSLRDDVASLAGILDCMAHETSQSPHDLPPDGFPGEAEARDMLADRRRVLDRLRSCLGSASGGASLDIDSDAEAEVEIEGGRSGDGDGYGDGNGDGDGEGEGNGYADVHGNDNGDGDDGPNF